MSAVPESSGIGKVLNANSAIVHAAGDGARKSAEASRLGLAGFDLRDGSEFPAKGALSVYRPD
jgi:hypothetical protein